MKPVFYSAPILIPRPYRSADNEIRSGMQQFIRRALELWQAAALIDAAEPGLLTPSDLEAARRRGLAAGRRVLTDSPKGKAKIAYFRALTGEGLYADPKIIQAMANDVWLLENRYGLADAYLRAVSDAALQKQAASILCPNPLRRDRLEAVFLPDCSAAFISMSALENTNDVSGYHVHLDRIPAADRKQALRNVLRENRKWVEALTQRAAAQLRNAEILRDLKADTCTADNPCL